MNDETTAISGQPIKTDPPAPIGMDRKVVMVKVADLVPYTSNARTHSPEQIEQIAASIREFGFTQPILTDGENGILAGHGRVLASIKLGLAEVPTIPLDGLSKAQQRAYVLADNKLAINAGWDDELLASELNACDFHLRSQIIWVKQQLVIGRGDYHWMHEPCWYAVRKGKTGHYAGDRKQRTVWEIANHAGASSKDDGATSHGTQKPVECMKRPIENNSSPGQAVYEPFSGSGTTIIAGEMTGRSVHAIELSPTYVDVNVLRWQAFTGAEAVHEETGLTYAELAAQRAGEDADDAETAKWTLENLASGEETLVSGAELEQRLAPE